jgi:conjugative transfer signal peptidase TraF
MAVIILLAIGGLGCVALSSGLRFNGTPSFPEGFYLETRETARRGDLVFVSLPSSPAIDMAKDRGYLSVAYCSVNHLLKRLVGVAGDRVKIDSAGVEVNGIGLKNSAPLTYDAAGRPMVYYPIKDYVLGPDEVLLMSEYNPASFDSRYFGPLHTSAIESVVRPVWTWN